MSMNVINAKPGFKVKVTKSSAKNGHFDDQQMVKGLIDRILTIKDIQQGDNVTVVWFEEVDGVYNSVNFEDIVLEGSMEQNLLIAAGGIDFLAQRCYANAHSKGFWKKYETISAILHDIDNADGDNDGLEEDYKHSFYAQRLALIHSEVSEALEGDRKTLMDDKLPQYKMQDVELADAIIRILDLAGGMNIPLGEIILKKMGFNSTREFMHGKKY
jgi:NTP pyrophosphatase (non-canonical NTP hydrolase)